MSVSCFTFSGMGLVLMTSSSFLSALFSVLTASSPKSFPPPGSSSLSCLGPDSSSPRSPWPALASGPSSRKRVTLLPPFLSDQAQQVQALGTFYLFCQATGELRAQVSMAVPYCSPLSLTLAWFRICTFSSIDICRWKFLSCPVQ